MVGSGVGGLGCAALLAHLGRRVLVLERHVVPGGFAQVFRRGPFRWDVGVHAVGEVGPEDAQGRLFAALTDDFVQWASMGSVVDEVRLPRGRTVALRAGREALVEGLVEDFPAHEGAIRSLFSEVETTAHAVRCWLTARNLPPHLARWIGGAELARGRQALALPAGGVLADRLPDPVLRRVVGVRWGYHGTPLDQAAHGAQALVTDHYAGGGYYPVGGAGRITEGLARVVARSGGAVRLGAEVAGLLVRDDRVAGVRLADGEEIAAPLVFSAMGATATVRRLIPEAMKATAWARALDAMPLSPAHVALYLGFEGDPCRIGARGHNLWLREEPDAPLFVAFSSLRDPAWHRSGRHVATAIGLVPQGTFPHVARDGGYAAHKECLKRRMLARLERSFPGIGGLIAHAELSTPLTTTHYTGAPGGAIYGLAATPARFSGLGPTARTPLPGLFLAGADVGMMGVAGALLGGVFAAVAAAGTPALRWYLDTVPRPRRVCVQHQEYRHATA